MPLFHIFPFDCTRGLPAARWLALSAAFLGLAGTMLGQTASTGDRLMILTVDMTKAGRKVTPATPEAPVYYVPVVLGYRERGELVKHFQRKPASDEAIQQLLIGTLAKQGYLLASREHPPSLVIAFEWGSIAPVFRGRRVINAVEMREIILGSNAWHTVSHYGGYSQEMRSLTARHYVMISAFEYHRAPPKEEVLLWRAHSTTDLWGNYLDEVIKPLIRLAGPSLGRATKPGGAWSEATGKVILGELKVLESPADGKSKPEL